MFYDQGQFDVKCEWGERGLAALKKSDVAVIVDVLSFSTTVDIATGRGAMVFPFQFAAADAEQYACEKNAVIAGRRGGAGLSLSPLSMLDVAPGTRIVLPSPNGATLSRLTGAIATLAGCLRNCSAVADYAAKIGRKVAVIAAGERWEDGSLRPAIEDWIGAGAIIAGLSGSRSPEAQAAAQAFEQARGDLQARLKRAASGLELIEKGFQSDVDLASKLNCSSCVPRLIDGAYVNANSLEAAPRC
jgi:2-phosphosulfolactate phosphatase